MGFAKKHKVVPTSARMLIGTEAKSSVNRNRHEHPRRQSLASAGVADRHPILTHGLDGRRDIAVGVAQELLGLAGLVCRSEQRTALIVFTVNQDGQEQS